MLLSAGLAAPASAAPEPRYERGRYLIEAQTVMPHLEEMRRTRSRSEVCGDGHRIATLFPVFTQPALRGCDLEAEGGARLRLRCADDRVATGSGHLGRGTDGRLRGALDIRMGGKNMTFSHYVTAVRTGDCGAD